MASSSLIVWVFIVVTVTVVILQTSRTLLSLRWLPAIFLVVLGLLASIAGLLTLRSYWSPRQVTVVITSPRESGAEQGIPIIVSGTVQPTDATVILLVRSEKDVRWWPQSLPERSATGEQASWTIHADLGTNEDKNGDGKPDGLDENFTILALASADSWLFNILTDRVANLTSPTTEVPRWAKSDLLVVRRKK